MIAQSRKNNLEEARNTFDFFTGFMTSDFSKTISWNPIKNRSKRTQMVLAIMAFWRIAVGEEYVFFDKRYLASIIDIWKLFQPSLDEEIQAKFDIWIKIYEERLKHKDKIAEIGERFVDLSSSYSKLPLYFNFILEYESSPVYGDIIKDFRKLLTILAPLKVGVFHLPRARS